MKYGLQITLEWVNFLGLRKLMVDLGDSSWTLSCSFVSVKNLWQEKVEPLKNLKEICDVWLLELKLASSWNLHRLLKNPENKSWCIIGIVLYSDENKYYACWPSCGLHHQIQCASNGDWSGLPVLLWDQLHYAKTAWGFTTIISWVCLLLSWLPHTDAIGCITAL